MAPAKPAWRPRSASAAGSASPFSQYGINLGFNEPIGIDEAAHLQDGVDRPDVSKELAMYLGNSFPILDAGQKDSSADDIL